MIRTAQKAPKVSDCAGCGAPIDGSALFIGRRIYHHECSPYKWSDTDWNLPTVRAGKIEKQKPGPKPSAYKHIAAFYRSIGETDHKRYLMQRRASRHNAPIDSVYWSIYGQWKTVAECGVSTRMAIEIELNRGKG